MKKLILAGLVLATLAGISYLTFLHVSNSLDSEAEHAVIKYAAAINEYRIKEGKYPKDLGFLNVRRKNLLFVVSPTKIRMTIDHGKVQLYYMEFPLGPARVYDLATKTWHYEEI